MKNKTLWIVIGVVVVIALALGGMYNNLVTLDQNAQKAWANVESQYQRRADLVPNLVSTVKGAANFEQSTLTAVTEARASATSIKVDPTKLDPETIAAYQNAQGQLSTALGKLLAISENYPTLTATQNFQDLQAQLEGTENRIAVARKDFNDAVQSYDTAVRTFPNSLIAGMFGFSTKGYFTADQGADQAPNVQF